MFSFEKSVGGVIFRREGGQIKYLLLHYLSGHWDFPKGHQEKGETDEDTLRREVREETGIEDLKITRSFKAQVKYFYRAKEEEREKRKKAGKNINVIKRVTYYLARTETEKINLSFEHKGFEWLDYGLALERMTYKNSKDILKKADNYLRACS